MDAGRLALGCKSQIWFHLMCYYSRLAFKLSAKDLQSFHMGFLLVLLATKIILLVVNSRIR